MKAKKSSPKMKKKKGGSGPKKTAKKSVRPKRIVKKKRPKIVKKTTQKSKKELKKKPHKVHKKISKIKEKPKKGKEIISDVIQKEVKSGKVKILTRVKEVMEIEYKTISDEKKLGDALEVMLEYSIPYLPVIDKKKVIIGILDQENLMQMMEKRSAFDSSRDEVQFQKIVNLKVTEAMLKPTAINEEDTVVDAVEKMTKGNLNTLFVTGKKGKIIGLVTKEKAMQAIQSEFFMSKVSLSGRVIIKTGIDTFVELLKEKKEMKIKEVMSTLKVSMDKVEEWATLLEDEDIIEIIHPMFGEIKLRWKDEK